MNDISLPQLFTYKETAIILKISPVTLRRWVSQGFMPCTKIGGAVRFTIEQIKSIMCEKSVTNGGK